MESRSPWLLKQELLKQGEKVPASNTWGLGLLGGTWPHICSSVMRTYARLALVLLLHCVQQQADCRPVRGLKAAIAPHKHRKGDIICRQEFGISCRQGSLAIRSVKA